MNIFFRFLIFFVVFALEWVFSPLSLGVVSAPLVSVFLFFLFLRVSLGAAAWIAVLAGFFLETYTLLPVGTLSTVFLAEVAIAKILQAVFSNTEAVIVRSLSLGIMLLSYFIMVPFVETLFGGNFINMAQDQASYLVGSMVWSVAIPTAIFVFRIFLYKFWLVKPRTPLL